MDVTEGDQGSNSQRQAVTDVHSRYYMPKRLTAAEQQQHAATSATIIRNSSQSWNFQGTRGFRNGEHVCCNRERFIKLRRHSNTEGMQ